MGAAIAAYAASQEGIQVLLCSDCPQLMFEQVPPDFLCGTLNAPMKIEHGEEILDVNFNRIQDSLFKAILLKPSCLSGAEVKFLLHYWELTQDAFSKTVKVERSLVSKWESMDLKATGMSSHIEIFLRLKLAKLKNQDIVRKFHGRRAGH